MVVAIFRLYIFPRRIIIFEDIAKCSNYNAKIYDFFFVNTVIVNSYTNLI